MPARKTPLEALIVAVPETSGSALYGMVDVLAATGNLWQTLARSGDSHKLIRPRIVSHVSKTFRCGNNIPVSPELNIKNVSKTDILILPELWLGPDEDFHGRYPDLVEWIRKIYRKGAFVYSACSGSIMLAETGLLNGCNATSHWAYADLFRKQYPEINFLVEPNMTFADPAGRIVTAGGTTSWHDLAIHIIARHCGPGEALKIAKVYLLKWHAEGQLPYSTLVRRNPHADAVVSNCEKWLRKNYHRKNCVSQAVKNSGIPERTLKRRFRNATGTSLIEYIQNLRIEEARRLLESTTIAIDEISHTTGYEEPAFFRRLFKRSTGLTPGEYRRMFKPVMEMAR